MDKAQSRYHEAVNIPVHGTLQSVRVLITADGVVQPLLDYFTRLEAVRHHSPSWQRKVVTAVGLLYDYTQACPPTDADCDGSLGPGRLSTDASATYLSRFVDALRCGTISEDGTDPTGLYWPRMTLRKVNQTVRAITGFSDYCARKHGTPTLNAEVPATFAQRLTTLRAIDHRNAHSLFAHLANAKGAEDTASRARAIPTMREHTVVRSQRPFFPFEHDAALMSEGFKRPHRAEHHHLHHRYRLRDLLITLLCRYGGLRESEPFHLFVTDVVRVQDSDGPPRARVLLWHPVDSEYTYVDPVTRATVTVTRAEYLKRRYGLMPRNERTDAQRAGWKDLMFDSAALYAEVRWCEPGAAELFWALWESYVTEVRQHLAPEHPFAFCSEHREASGQPYTLKQYVRAFERAIRRIGLEPSKEAGTTPHGLRHAYGQTLRRCGIDDKTIQIAMHHKSVESQQVYTAPELAEVNDRLTSAMSLIRSGAVEGLAPSGLLGSFNAANVARPTSPSRR